MKNTLKKVCSFQNRLYICIVKQLKQNTMTTFTSNNEAKKVAEQIAKTTQVFFTNEGLEILFTSEDKNQKEIANELKSVFSDVKVKGRKVQSIVINRINQVTNGLRITEVAY